LLLALSFILSLSNFLNGDASIPDVTSTNSVP